MAVSIWEERRHPERLAGLVAACKSARKVRLLACAVIRHAPFHSDGRTVWDGLPSYDWFRPCRPGSQWDIDLQEAIGIIERHADGLATACEWEVAQTAGFCAVYSAESYTPMYTETPSPGCWPAYLSVKLVERATRDRLSRLAGHLLDYRDTFRAVCPAELHPGNGEAVCWLIRDSLMGPHRRRPIDPAWLTGTVVGLARTAYDSHSFAGLPVLADALEEAGCTDRAVLRHCREPGLHARGCWVLDRVLGLG